jgi:hypothetical protein
VRGCCLPSDTCSIHSVTIMMLSQFKITANYSWICSIRYIVTTSWIMTLHFKHTRVQELLLSVNNL